VLQYNVSFYLQYLARWPEYCLMAESVGLQRTAYSTCILTAWLFFFLLYDDDDHHHSLVCVSVCAVLGKVEGEGTSWHGHVTAVTVSPTYRKQGIARQLMDTLEDVTANRHDGYFVDLFVRASNKAAISMYEKVTIYIYVCVCVCVCWIDSRLVCLHVVGV